MTVGGFHPVYMVELRSARPMEVDEPAFLKELTAGLGRVETSPPKDAFSLLFLKDIPIRLKDAEICAQIALLRADRKVDPAGVQDAVGQSWRLPDAAKRVEGERESLLLHDFMSSALDHAARRRILSTALRALLRHSNASLAWFVPTSQFLDARELLTSLDGKDERENPCLGFLNVRFYTITNSEGDMIMDTLGLTALGLTDFQVHFKGLDPRAVAGVLHSLGSYVFERGDVVKSGHTVQGVERGSTWTCRTEESLLEPKREVLDLNPGPAFAAGRRN